MSHAPATTTASTRSVALDELADHLIALVLKPRETILKHEAPKAKRVELLIRDCRRRHAKPMHMLAALSFTDVEDARIPIEQIVEPYERFAELLRDRRREIKAHGVETPSLLPLQLRESRAEEVMNEAQLTVQARPDDPAALEFLIAASAAYDETQDLLVSAARKRLASLRGRALREGDKRISAPFEHRRDERTTTERTR